MSEIIIIMISGIMFGYILRNKKKIVTLADRLTGWSIYLLLFLMGISVGLNDTVINNFAVIGLHSIILTLCGLTGSIFLSYIIYIFFFREPKRNK